MKPNMILSLLSLSRARESKTLISQLFSLSALCSTFICLNKVSCTWSLRALSFTNDGLSCALSNWWFELLLRYPALLIIDSFELENENTENFILYDYIHVICKIIILFHKSYIIYRVLHIHLYFNMIFYFIKELFFLLFIIIIRSETFF